MDLRSNPYELPEDRPHPDHAVPDGPVSESPPAKGMTPICPTCGGRVHVVVGLGNEARWVCERHGGVVVPRWIPDPAASPRVFNFAPVSSQPSSRPRGLRQSDIQVAVRVPKPATRPESQYLDAPPLPSTRPR